MASGSDPGTAQRRYRVAMNMMQWTAFVRDNNDIDAKYRKPGAESQLRISDAAYNPGSDISHTEYLHLRAVWYHYPSLDHFTELFQDDNTKGYKGYVTPEIREKARRICDEKARPQQWNTYLNELKIAPDKELLKPTPKAGFFAMVRYWQCLVVKHTKDIQKASDEEATLVSKVSKPGSLAAGFSNLAISDKKPSKRAATPTTPARPTEFKPGGTPQVQSYKPAKGNDANRPASDETYANTALLLFLQAITRDLPGQFGDTHWAATRIPLRLRDKNKGLLMEARVDGYLCRSRLQNETFIDIPLAICETKPFVRRAGETPTERQEAAEMACWIAQHSGSREGLLQNSASGKKRQVTDMKAAEDSSTTPAANFA